MVVVAGVDVVDFGCFAVASWVVCGGLAVSAGLGDDCGTDGGPVAGESCASVACVPGHLLVLSLDLTGGNMYSCSCQEDLALTATERRAMASSLTLTIHAVKRVVITLALLGVVVAIGAVLAALSQTASGPLMVAAWVVWALSVAMGAVSVMLTWRRRGDDHE